MQQALVYEMAKYFEGVFHAGIFANKISFNGDLKNCSTMKHSNPKSNGFQAFR